MPFHCVMEISQEEEAQRMEHRNLFLTSLLFCDKIVPLITSMTIDKSGINSLTNYRGGIVRSDHM